MTSDQLRILQVLHKSMKIQVDTEKSSISAGMVLRWFEALDKCMPTERDVELSKADAEDRVLILPFKMPSKVYHIESSPHGYSKPYVDDHYVGSVKIKYDEQEKPVVESVGTLTLCLDNVFTSKEEAQAVLDLIDIGDAEHGYISTAELTNTVKKVRETLEKGDTNDA